MGRLLDCRLSWANVIFMGHLFHWLIAMTHVTNHQGTKLGTKKAPIALWFQLNSLFTPRLKTSRKLLYQTLLRRSSLWDDM